MTDILKKTCTDKEYADFAVYCNENNKNIVQDEQAFYALAPCEVLQNGVIVDISETEDYKSKVLAQQNKIKKIELQEQIDALDAKSIRALREGGIKDEATGQTWIQYYTSQIAALRAEILSI